MKWSNFVCKNEKFRLLFLIYSLLPISPFLVILWKGNLLMKSGIRRGKQQINPNPVIGFINSF